MSLSIISPVSSHLFYLSLGCFFYLFLNFKEKQLSQLVLYLLLEKARCAAASEAERFMHTNTHALFVAPYESNVASRLRLPSPQSTFIVSPGIN